MRNHRINLYLLFSLALTAAVFAGCNGSGNSSAGPSGVLNLAVSDTPVDGATSVVVTFTGVEIMPRGTEDQSGDDSQSSSSTDNQGESADEGGDDSSCAPAPSTGTGAMGAVGDDDSSEDCSDNSGDGDTDGAPPSGTVAGAPPATTTGSPAATTGTGATGAGDNDADDQGMLTFNFATPQSIDLMKQQGTNSAALLNGVSLPAGDYAWIRLMVAATGNTITLSDGSVHNLVIPSGDESGLKLVHGFTVAAGGAVNFTIDFDLRESVILANGQYILKPVLHIVNNQDMGRIAGTVASTFTLGTTSITDPACKPAAYVYAGANATPVDINPGSSGQPVGTATVGLDNDSGNYTYSAGFLAPGAYTVALVCAAGDNPAAADSLTFSTPKNATVASDQTATVDFP